MSDAPPVKAEVPRDRDLERRMLEAVVADRNDDPRTKQAQVGPSSIGFCRELLRAQLFEQDWEGLADVVTEETHWATAAHVGKVMGEDLERIFGERMSNVVTQSRVTTTFPMLGVSISGALDLAFLDDNYVTDLKSTTDIGGLLYDLQKNADIIETLLMIWREGKLFNWSVETPDGGYELTAVMIAKFSKLHYWVQVATYVVGCIQAGILDGNAEGRLAFYDRAGDFQEFVAVIISNEELAMFFELGQHRVMQVAQAQELFERTNNLHLVHQLRDQTPSFCFSPKVMCPLRERCWGGSEWEPVEVLESAEVSASLDRYIEGRRLKKIGEGMTSAARAELKGIEGVTADGRSVSWPGDRINVVETTKGKAARETAAKSAVDLAQEAMARVALDPSAEPDIAGPTERTDGGPHTHKTKPGTKACAEGRCNPKTIVSDVLTETPAEGAQSGTTEGAASVNREEPESAPAESIVPSAGPDSPGESDATVEAQYFDGSGAELAYQWTGEPQHSESQRREQPEHDPRVDAVYFVDTDPRPLEAEAPEEPEWMPPPPDDYRMPLEMQTAEEARERAKPLSGDELKAALEVDTSAGRLRKMQEQQETTGQVARNRAAAQAKRDGAP